MSNKAYLHLSDSPRPLPGRTDANVKDNESVVLCCDVCVPLLWLAMFRPEDMRQDSIAGSEGPFEFQAPLVERELALSRLEGAGERFNAILGTDWNFKPLETALKDYLLHRPGRHLSLDVLELDACEALAAAVSIYAQAGGEGAREALVELTTVMPERPALLDPTRPEAMDAAEPEDFFNLMRCIGYGWYEDVPWADA